MLNDPADRDPTPGHWTRRALLLGGPLAAENRPMRLPHTIDWPRMWCTKPAAGPGADTWQHYVPDPDLPGVYHYAGPCSLANHADTPLPHEHDTDPREDTEFLGETA